MIIYIAGPITGKPDGNKAAFDAAEKKLKAQGHAVLNPRSLPDDLPRTAYMPICLAMLQQADAIYLLEGWINSAGARLEADYALYQNKTVSIQDQTVGQYKDLVGTFSENERRLT